MYFKSIYSTKACKSNKVTNSYTFAFQKLLDDVQLKEQEAIKLEVVLRDLPPDAETQSLEAILARLRTQIVTLMSKIEQGKTVVEVCIQ
jgi:hypothetical protein